MRRGSGIYREASAAPPDSDATTISTGASGGFLIPSQDRPCETLWAALTDSDRINTSQLDNYVSRLENNVMFRRGEVATLLATLRTMLMELSDQTDGSAKAEIGVGDLVLMAHLLLRHQP